MVKSMGLGKQGMSASDFLRMSNRRPLRSTNSIRSSDGAYNDYKAALNLDYEIDLWGRIRSLTRQAAANAEASIRPICRNTAASIGQ